MRFIHLGGEFFLLPGLRAILALGAGEIPLCLVPGDVVVLLALFQLFFLGRVLELGEHRVFLDPIAVLDTQLDESVPRFRL